MSAAQLLHERSEESLGEGGAERHHRAIRSHFRKAVRAALLQNTGDELLTADGRAEDDYAIVRRRKIAFPHGDRGAGLASREAISSRSMADFF